MNEAETDDPAVVLAIVCDGGQCPTCEDGRSLIGPCEDCTEYFIKHDRFPRRKRSRAGDSHDK